MQLTSEQLENALILVVDDDPTTRMLICAALEKAGFRVEEADGGNLALEKFARLRPDGVLLDVMMPDLDGFAACAAIRQLPGGELVPVMMVTGLEDVSSIHRAFEAGATDFITKPINWTVMGYRVRYMLRASQTLHNFRLSQERLAQAQRLARLGHWELEPERQLLYCSPEVCTLLGRQEEQCSVELQQFLEVVHPDDRQVVARAFERTLAQRGAHSLTYRVQLSDDEVRILYQQGDWVADEIRQKTLIMGVLQDVTEAKQAEEQIRRLAFFDSLTGLSNRILFKDRVNQALSYAERRGGNLALLFLDLDRFKRINDTLGHHVGDLLLQEVASRIQHCVRKSDLMSRFDEEADPHCVSRLGGDEFTILLSELTQPQLAAKVARRINAAISEPMLLEGCEVSVSASIGISIFPLDGEDADTLIKNADAAMYFAKEKGRNNAQFYRESMNESALERLAMENDLRKGLERDELLLYYQPQFAMDGRRIVGCEALVRWQHPERGLVPPGAFIPLAEESGLIHPLTEWVVRAACRQLKDWQEAGLDIPRVAVNLSNHQFGVRSILPLLEQTLQETGLDPACLELEITESAVMQKEQESINTLERIKASGMRVAIDDFGTGYSSLSYLQSFPIDTLKIDRSFVKEITAAENTQAIIRAIIALGQSLQLNIVAEGVETEEQWQLLRQLGCREMQGFLFSRPLPAAEFAELVRSSGVDAEEQQGGEAR